MIEPNKVILEVTPDSWTWKIPDMNFEFTMHRESEGSFKSRDQKGDIYDRLPEHPELAGAIDNEDPMDIAQALLYGE